ncbi:MAG: ATP-dependent Clp protease ATP-binding subunit ClpC, partial [Chloroflexi bacterium]|nr:ATP-dependent Clp protease ATP-binding subunit ClpC [Chloroflexota bacterium]
GELKHLFKPEFLSRVDEVLVFQGLTREDIDKIVDIQMERLNKRLAEHRIALTLTEAGRTWLVQEGFDPQFGARPLRRAIQHNIEDALAERLLDGSFADGDAVVADAQEDRLVLRVATPEPAKPAGRARKQR